MLLTCILVVLTIAHGVSFVCVDANGKLIAELRARHPELRVGPVAALLILASRWLLTVLWVAHGVDTGDLRYAAVGVIPVAFWAIQRAVLAGRKLPADGGPESGPESDSRAPSREL